MKGKTTNSQKQNRLYKASKWYNQDKNKSFLLTSVKDYSHSMCSFKYKF